MRKKPFVLVILAFHVIGVFCLTGCGALTVERVTGWYEEPRKYGEVMVLESDGTYKYGLKPAQHFSSEGKFEVKNNMVVLHWWNDAMTSPIEIEYAVQGDKLVGVSDFRVYVKKKDKVVE